MSSYLIAGLGNIGPEYAGTRHNIGFDIADAFVSRHRLSFQPDRLAFSARFSLKGRSVTVIKPTTYMNLSGFAVRHWLDKTGAPLDHLLVLVDDIALPLNKLRLRPGGSAAGHNGLRHIEAVLGTQEYPRLRFGIGSNFPKGNQVGYVLGHWSEEELPQVRFKIEQSVEVIENFIFMGISRSMTEVNKKDFTL